MEELLQVVFVVFGGAYAFMEIVWALFGSFKRWQLYNAIYRTQLK